MARFTVFVNHLSGNLGLRSLIKDLLAFARPVFPLPGRLLMVGPPFDFPRCCAPHRFQFGRWGGDRLMDASLRAAFPLLHSPVRPRVAPLTVLLYVMTKCYGTLKRGRSPYAIWGRCVSVMLLHRR
jgi:hypothetical protein